MSDRYVGWDGHCEGDTVGGFQQSFELIFVVVGWLIVMWILRAKAVHSDHENPLPQMLFGIVNGSKMKYSGIHRIATKKSRG